MLGGLGGDHPQAFRPIRIMITGDKWVRFYHIRPMPRDPAVKAALNPSGDLHLNMVLAQREWSQQPHLEASQPRPGRALGLVRGSDYKSGPLALWRRLEAGGICITPG